MRINVHAGHTSQNGKACGACGIVKESVEDRKIKDALIKILRERGHTVYDCTSEGSSASDNLYQIVKKCNAHEVDLDVSIHLNCSNGQGHGTETLIYSSGSKAKKYAEKIDKKIAALGFRDRGVKVRGDLYVLHRTNAPALLVETFFCDNMTDCKLYKHVGAKGIAKAIADGIAPAEKKSAPKVSFLYPTINLKKGDRNEQVLRLQRCLNVIDHAGLAEDGSFGPATEKAVKHFKKKHMGVRYPTSNVKTKTRAKIRDILK